MSDVRISEDFVPVSEFKAQAAQLLRRLSETGAPLVVTQNGKPAGVLLSPKAFDDLTEQARFVSAVREGLAQADQGLVRTNATVKKHFRTRFARQKK